METDRRKAQRKYNKKAKRYYIYCYPPETAIINKLESERKNGMTAEETIKRNEH